MIGSGDVPKMDPLTIIPGRPDQVVADELRAQFDKAIEPILAIMVAARRASLDMTFNLEIDAVTMRARVANLKFARWY